MIWRWNYSVLWLYIATTLPSTISSETTSDFRPISKFDKWTHITNGEYIPMEFYNTMEAAESSKRNLQYKLRNFLENLQKNLTTSTVLSFVDADNDKIQNQLAKLYELADYFNAAAEEAKKFAHNSETYYEAAKNSSFMLLLRLRQIPATQPTAVKLLLTNYFAEMEFFHIMFSEIMDEALEYTLSTLLAIYKTFAYYADIQRFILLNWSFKNNVGCSREYTEFLQRYSAQIFKCSTAHELNIAYDVFAMTEVTSKYIMRQLEFRIQRLFNCFLYGNYEIRCKFLENAEKDFEGLFSKIEDLEIYYDLKTKRGRVSAFRLRRQTMVEGKSSDTTMNRVKCIPENFPESQMHESLKLCFYNIVKY